MDRYAAGDASAFPQLYDALAPRLHGYLVRQTRDRALVADVLQQTLLQMHVARASFVPGSQVTPWCFAIARRILIDRVRRAKFEAPCHGDGVERDDLPSTGGAPDEDLEMRELEQRVQSGLDRLPPQQRTAYELVNHEGLTLREAAEVLGTTVGAVKLRVHRAYKAIRGALRSAGFDLKGCMS